MRIVVIGSRYWEDYLEVFRRLERLHPVTLLGHGASSGAEDCGRRVAESLGWPIRVFPLTGADWKLHGKMAGALRNSAMLAEVRPDRVVAFRLSDVPSPGVDHCIGLARGKGIFVELYERPATEKERRSYDEAQVRRGAAQLPKPKPSALPYEPRAPQPSGLEALARPEAPSRKLEPRKRIIQDHRGVRCLAVPK